MNAAEVGAVLAVFESAFGWAPVSEQQARVWRQALVSDPAEGAADAAGEWVGSQNRPPTIAQFRDLRRRIAVRNRPPALPEDTSGELFDRDARLARVREARQILARVPSVVRRPPSPLPSDYDESRPRPVPPAPCPYCELDPATGVTTCSGGPIADRSR